MVLAWETLVAARLVLVRAVPAVAEIQETVEIKQVVEIVREVAATEVPATRPVALRITREAQAMVQIATVVKMVQIQMVARQAPRIQL